jgi:toxin ParE1/3/4
VSRIRVLPAAERDVDQAAEYFAREANVDIALRFLSAVEETYQRLGELPQSGTPWHSTNPSVSGLRFVRVSGFESYLAFHFVSPGVVEVVRVLHGARDLLAILGDEPTH